jgi:hypothetical protein
MKTYTLEEASRFSVAELFAQTESENVALTSGDKCVMLIQMDSAQGPSLAEDPYDAEEADVLNAFAEASQRAMAGITLEELKK